MLTSGFNIDLKTSLKLLILRYRNILKVSGALARVMIQIVAEKFPNSLKPLLLLIYPCFKEKVNEYLHAVLLIICHVTTTIVGNVEKFQVLFKYIREFL